MFRSGASRSFLHSLNTSSTPAIKATSSPVRQQLRSQLCTLSRRPQSLAITKPLVPQTLALTRWQSSDRKPVDKIDHTREDKIGEKQFTKADPARVSSESTIAAPIAMKGGDSEEAEPDMMGGIKSDLV